jgi:quercetin dioxygenase-like cupin family protein
MFQMSSLNVNFIAGKLSGVVYTFQKAGDTLPMHTHTGGNAHITIVARGKIKAHGNEWQAEYSAGAVIDFPTDQSHEFIALEDDSRIVNIVK